MKKCTACAFNIFKLEGCPALLENTRYSKFVLERSSKMLKTHIGVLCFYKHGMTGNVLCVARLTGDLWGHCSNSTEAEVPIAVTSSPFVPTLVHADWPSHTQTGPQFTPSTLGDAPAQVLDTTGQNSSYRHP